jgi:hypothetical protein
MSGFSAVIATPSLAAANATLQAAGLGPNNFSVPGYSSSALPTFATFHAWDDPVFEAAVLAISGVTISRGDDPLSVVAAALTTKSAKWGSNAPLLTGVVTPGLYKDSADKLWLVIQSYNTATWPDPSAPGLTAIVVPARTPGVAVPWYQTFAADAFKLVNPFTGTGDVCTHNGKTWRVTQADGSGNNVWAPGVFGWTEIV